MSYTINNKIEFIENQQLDAFGRLRVSEQTTLFDSPLKQHEEIYLWNSILSGGATGTYSLTQNLYLMNVSTTGDKVIRQTKQYFQLQNGKSHMGFMGLVFDDTGTNLVQKAGVFDDDNGFYVKKSSSGISFVIRTKATGTVLETEIPQSSWNGDQMNGSGKSGINIDFSKMQIIAFDMSYTGGGFIRFGFLVDGVIHYAHTHSSHNVFSTNSLTTPSLPVRYEIESTGSSGQMKQQSSCILVEGVYNQRGVVRSVDTGLSAISASKGSLKPAISIRLKSGYRSSIIIPKSINILQTSNNTTLYYALYMFTTLTGASWQNAANCPNCISEYDTSATSFTGGIKIASGYLPSKAAYSLTQDIESILNLAGNYDGTTDILTLVISGVERTVPYLASLQFNELF